MILAVLAAGAVLALACWLVASRQGARTAVPPAPESVNTAPAKMTVRIGTAVEGGKRNFLTLDEDMLHRGLLCLGRTGQGKSRFLANLAHECAVVHGRSTLVFDLDGDLTEDVAARVARDVCETGDKRLLRRVHYLELSPEQLWRYDPFAFRLPKAVPPELLASARAAWLHCKVDAVGQVLLRNQGQASFEGMPRLQRVLTDVLTVVGTEIEGRRLSLGDAAFVLDFGHELNPRLWEKLEGKLPAQVAADFRLIRGMKRVEDMRRETESTVNKLRSMFGPVLQSLFGDPGLPSFNLFDAIQKGHLVLVNLRPSLFCSETQAVAVGRMLLYDIIATTTATPREMRKTSVTIIDEAATLLMPDIGPSLRRGRKYKRATVLANQELSSFDHGDFDLTDVVLSQPETVVSFQQRLPDDLKLLGRLMFTSKLSFEQLVHEVERRGMTRFLPIIERSWGVNTNRSWNEAESDGDGGTEGYAHSTSLAEALGWQKGTSDTTGGGNTTTRNRTETTPLAWATLGVRGTVAEGGATARTQQQNHGQSSGESGTETKTEGNQSNWGTSWTHTLQRGQGGGEGDSVGWSLRYAQVQDTLRELQATGQLKKAVADQLEQFAAWIFGLAQRHAYVLMGSECHYMEALDVPDPFPSPLSVVKAVQWVRREMARVHGYLFTPDMTPAEEERRLRELFGVGEAGAGAPALGDAGENPIA